jgi:hypothetical protein
MYRLPKNTVQRAHPLGFLLSDQAYVSRPHQLVAVVSPRYRVVSTHWISSQKICTGRAVGNVSVS